jgi:hypothetical protein
MNIIRKETSTTSSFKDWNYIRDRSRILANLRHEISMIPRRDLARLLIICGKVELEKRRIFEKKASEISADFVHIKPTSWQETRETIRNEYDKKKHSAVLLIGNNRELPGTKVQHRQIQGFTDYFIQDLEDNQIPEVVMGRVFGDTETVLYHMDPCIIDSNIAVLFDNMPHRSQLHVDSLNRLGFSVEIFKKFKPRYSRILEVSEFILQFSDGYVAERVHGTPERWASNNVIVLHNKHIERIKFKGYPVVYSEACRTAQEGPLLKAFLKGGACYIGATLETMNNTEVFDNWEACPFSDGWKFGFLDLLDSYDTIGEVKLAVDNTLARCLTEMQRAEMEAVSHGAGRIQSSEVASVVEWMLYGNPLRRTTVGRRADFRPGRIQVDT